MDDDECIRDDMCAVCSCAYARLWAYGGACGCVNVYVYAGNCMSLEIMPIQICTFVALLRFDISSLISILLTRNNLVPRTTMALQSGAVRY